MSMVQGIRDYFNGEFGTVDPDEELAIVWWSREDIECNVFDEEDGEFTPEEWQEIANTFNWDCHQGLSDLIHEIAMDVLNRRES
tara:strand:- start:262 stop:513 length:252 start_codon:yes stop_codon:yes gene_type:complete